MEPLMLLAALLVLLLLLLGAIIYEGRRLKEYQDTMNLFIEANSETFGVVNANAEVLRQAITRIEDIERTHNFIKMILDAHAHALKIYSPALDFESKLSDQIENT